jgi:hypothetical protein
MEFQVASDIHLEFYKDKEKGLPYLEVTAPISSWLATSGTLSRRTIQSFWDGPARTTDGSSLSRVTMSTTVRTENGQ